MKDVRTFVFFLIAAAAGSLGIHPLQGAAQESVRVNRSLPWERAQMICLMSRSEDSLRGLLSGDSGRTSRCNRDASRDEFIPGRDLALQFRDELCAHPERACERLVSQLQRLPSSSTTGGPDIAGVPFDSSCNPHPIWIQAQMKTPEAEAEIATSLRERTGSETTVAAVYQGPQWETAKRLVEGVRATLLQSLAAAPVQAPPAVLDRIRSARVLDPNDPSIPLEKKTELLKNCGVSPTAESQPSLGVPNAFAMPDEGWVVICPKMLLAAQSPAALGMILLHEMGHLIGPCQIGFALGALRTGPNCQIPTDPATPAGQLFSWRTRLTSQERCFHSAGLNEGRVPSWAIQALSKAEDAANASREGETPPSCGLKMEDFAASSDPQQGLTSACDPSNLYLTLSIIEGLNQGASDSRLQKLRSRIRTLRNTRELSHPNHNQFDESFSDYLASRYLPQVLDRVGVVAPAGENRGIDEALGFSTLCDVNRPRAIKNEVHPEGDERMAVFVSQPEIRARMGCAPRPSVLERTARTIGTCATFR